MPPYPLPITNATIPNFAPYNASTPTTSSFQYLLEQWRNPSDILAILMLIGGEIIKQSLGSLSGGYIVPVSFSFGWVAYSFSALLSVFGSGTLMPAADYKVKVINVMNGYSKDNESWVIGRLLRDYRYGPEDVNTTEATDGIIASAMTTAVVGSPAATTTCDVNTNVNANVDLEKGLQKETANKSCKQHPFHVSVFEIDSKKKAGVQDHDRVWWTGIIVALLQIIISMIPGLHEGDWVIFFVTVSGTILAFLGGSLSQWRHEKWSCRTLKEGDKQTVAITGGNGSRHVMVIKSGEDAFNLEDLATGPSYCEPLKSTSYFIVVFVALWLALLLTVAGINQNTWYLMGIGFIGMIQNVMAASAVRKSSAYGIHLKKVEGKNKHHFCGQKIMDTLKNVDREHNAVGWSLVSTFFPGGLRQDEIEYWDEEARKREQGKATPQSSEPESDNDAFGEAMDISACEEDALEPSTTTPRRHSEEKFQQS